MSAVTRTSAANGALAHLGEPPIADIDGDTSARAKACRLHFGKARDAALAAEFWNFATGWLTPAASETPSPGPLKTRYPLPPDVIVVRSVIGLGANEWAVESATVTVDQAETDVKVLVTNATAPIVEITRRVENPALWSPQFLAAFELQLAGLVAPSIARQATAGEHFEVRGDIKLGKAARTDAREKARQAITRSTSWIGARR